MGLVKPGLPDWSPSLNYSRPAQQSHLHHQLQHLRVEQTVMQLLSKDTCGIRDALDFRGSLDNRLIA